MKRWISNISLVLISTCLIYLIAETRSIAQQKPFTTAEHDDSSIRGKNVVRHKTEVTVDVDASDSGNSPLNTKTIAAQNAIANGSILPPVFSTAIAIIISWALFAIFCSLIHEAIVQIMAERGRFMKGYLEKQLFDRQNGINWASALYLHGSIDLLSRDTKKPTDNIDSTLFAVTLIDTVANAHIIRMQLQKNDTLQKYKQPVLQNFYAATQLLVKSDVVSMFRLALTSAEASSSNQGEEQVYKALVQNTAQWYLGMQDRLSLWYKKKTRQRLFWMGLLLGVALNVDSIQLFQFFNNNKDAAESLTAFYKANAESLESVAVQLDTTRTFSDTTKNKAIFALHEAARYSQKLESISNAVQLPIGPAALKNSLTLNGKINWPAFFYKLLGVLITGFAASLGAPFWFQVLKNFSSINKNKH